MKFTPAGGSVSLVVRAAESDLVAIDVADTGIGMPPAFLPHVFERFWQADSSTTRVHGGLGLAIVRHIVELHGGEVHASSEGEGRGSTFNVVLPAWVRQPAVPDVPSDPAEAEEATVDVSGVEMLVVDDDLAAREVCTAILESAGARVLTAASAAEAFVIVERETLKLMILDIGMPGENGLALLRRIRERELLHGVRSTPAIAMTAYSGATEREQAAAAGFAVHLTKPVLPRDLLSAVQRALSSEPLA